jgi:hypothetical protein
MFAKLFVSMYDGTLCANWKALVTFQQMLILCDREGFIDMTPQAIAARTGIPLEIITEGIEVLEKPDPHSRTSTLEGRRIERLDDSRPWGWQVINYPKYRGIIAAEDKREADRQRIANKRAKEKAAGQTDGAGAENATSRKVSRESPTVANVAHAEAEAEARKTRRPGSRSLTLPDSFHQRIIEAYHQILPGAPKVKAWSTKRRRALDARVHERCKDGRPADTIEYWRSLFKTVAASDFLCGRATDFVANIEWLLRPENFLKVIEGQYDNRRKNVAS